MLASVVAASLMAGGGQWTLAQAVAWQEKQPWMVGCNFIPSTAINQLEMWQKETWDPETIDRELGYAAGIGMNTARVYLHDVAWEIDKEGFKSRMGEFLSIASKHKIRPLFVFFDDCWDAVAQAGPQRAPKPGVHNSGWVRSPADDKRNWPGDFARLESYVKDVLSTFAKDERIYMWDLYNEPTNSGYGEKSFDLVKKAFQWAWAVRPSQPLTSGGWTQNEAVDGVLNGLSDVVTFHNYSDAENLRKHIANLRATGRPLVCTEWMARSAGCKVETNLPVFFDEKVACINWGLVSGKTNTIFPWGSPEGAAEPNPWFHDLFRKDGTPYSQDEAALFKLLTEKSKGG